MDDLSAGCETLEVRVGELKQLFHSIDAAPFRERDLDPRAEEFIVEWARELHSDAPLALVVRIERPSPAGDDDVVVQQAIAEYFGERALAARRRLRDLLRAGRTSLAIGLAFNAVVLVLADLFREERYGIIHDSLVIGGWVAMWRPIEIFLYDWWPIRADAKLFDRLAAMPVQVVAGR